MLSALIEIYCKNIHVVLTIKYCCFCSQNSNHLVCYFNKEVLLLNQQKFCFNDEVIVKLQSTLTKGINEYNKEVCNFQNVHLRLAW